MAARTVAPRKCSRSLCVFVRSLKEARLHRWWRPAVTYSAEDRQYHGFFAYLLQSRGESGPTTQEEYHVTHYTSHDLLNWEFRGFLPSGGKGWVFPFSIALEGPR